MIKLIGIIGAACFAFSAAPQAFQALRQGHSKGIAAGMLWMWLVGESFTMFYVASQPTLDWILLANYALNLAFLAPVFYFKYFERK